MSLLNLLLHPPEDKLKHVAGGVITGVVLREFTPGWRSWVLCNSAFGLKELYDLKTGKGNPEIMDFMASSLGCSLVYGLP